MRSVGKDLRLPPEVSVAQAAVLAACAGLEPFVPVTRVVDDKVEQATHATTMNLRDERLDVFKIPSKDVVHRFVFAYVIAHVLQRRVVER